MDWREERPHLHETLAIQIERLRSMKTKALAARYRELFGEDARSANHAYLLRRIAWRLQARAEGELSERARRRAAELANDADLRLRAPQSFWRELEDTAEHRSRDPRLPPAGTVLERTYRGQMVRVTVLANGFAYQGKEYASLSAIAQRATGTRWNGFHFFGLKQDWQHE